MKPAANTCKKLEERNGYTNLNKVGDIFSRPRMFEKKTDPNSVK